MKNRGVVAFALVAAWSAAAAALAMAGSASSPLSGSMGVAVLKTSAEADAQASGSFAMVFDQRGRTLVYWLRTGKLTGRAMAAKIYIGSPDKPGSALVTLCSPCKTSFVRHTVRLQSRQAALLAKNLRAEDSQGFSQLYVSLNTAANPSGELQGRIPYLCNPCPFPLPPPCSRLDPLGCAQ